ncbi:helix-turn-helix transcriptional regulator [Nodosilinea sp. LEGE 07298]|uniref:helix-turn-helix transcriptional regulator n=1 Tax=Nodosilinea sp. LEGE 07298 TaxID=2777970 RepID=UPI00187E0577|nr:helix-turn-helix transcriptional regulator [Nodosilinea sp. LEGE 07298]MBE9113930.1 helix-turn-helix transcriptional regulator [Nodosilinea sp. LEGE 07298]
MGKAGQVLKHVLEKYEVSQYSLAKTLGIERTNVYRWVHEMRDPTAETLLDIVKALKTLNYQAAEEFIELYLRDVLKDNEN